MISWELRGVKAFLKQVRALRRDLGDMSPVYKSWGITTQKWIHRNYKQSGGLLRGPKWKRLRPLTVQSRRKNSNRPLMDTGHLMRGWNYRVFRRGVVVGHPSKVAVYHEYGTGPYTIKPKDKKVLWFGVKPSQRWKGQKLGGHLANVADAAPKAWGKGGNPGIFANFVRHPGLPARRQLPNENEIMPELMKANQAWLEKLKARQGLK